MSDEVVSLFALMDAHLSKTALNEASSENDENNPSNGASHNLLSAPQRSNLAIPNYFPGNSPMKDFIAEKIAMTLKAKAKKKEEEEQQRLVEETRMLTIDDSTDMQFYGYEKNNIKKSNQQENLIDLTSAIIKQPEPGEVPLRSQNNDGACQEGPLHSTGTTDQKPSYMSGTRLVIDGYVTYVGELTKATDDSPSQSASEDNLEENSTWTMPTVEWNNEYEEAPMTPEEEHRIRMKQKETLWIEEELRKMRIRHQQEYPLLHLLDEMPPQPKLPRRIPQQIFKDNATKRLIYDDETCRYKEFDPTLPCTTDISYILNEKIKMGKCSTFGKILCSRVQHNSRLPFPFKRPKINSNIKRFDFKTKSPHDLCRENQTKSKIPLFLMMDIMDCL
ncbi:uncharacterized protein [Epargyreus clarus]|uniref:uncharacterized protein n=1 Tax=Epargyreus clarus TaxID=520877 RepID=UPI003C2D6D2D